MFDFASKTAPATIGSSENSSFIPSFRYLETAEIKMDIMEKSLIGESRAELVAESGSGMEVVNHEIQHLELTHICR